MEKLSYSAIEANVLKGVGTAGNAVGKFIGSIPLVREVPVDEFLQDGGTHLKKSALDMEKDAVHRFASIGNPGTRMFMEKMDEIIQIYNRTEQICFDVRRYIYCQRSSPFNTQKADITGGLFMPLQIVEMTSQK